ncbi:SanA protein [Soonwooa buanensis]|uniref:SanA protein n=1 Tax=Soonwooa buanensis TaxID=619805 RepID=A0A1T5G0N2_9FLAO|nr:ElyC/SanA/YdcF family protein [Soonwooa buanensis]SKC01919.1 SanA protein [Soonwooa buanensis]
MKIFKKILNTGLILIVVSALFVWWSNTTIESDTEAYNSFNINDIPKEKVGLVLGTGKTLANGQPNLYFNYRIEAAVELYKAGKVQYFIVSGDNSKKNYNEPEDMKLALMEKGVPENHIFEDFAGFRTLDSVVRAKEIFGQKELVIISQKFHNQRAVFLAQQNGMTAYGYNAKDVNKAMGFKTNLREKFARAKVYWDMFFGVEPKFGGEKIQIP